MSFRGRLLLFFTIIVVIPMIAVALVLFSLTADSETGKSDAEIAQGVRAAFGVYDGDRARARKPLQAIAGDAKLGAALAHPNRLRPIQSRLAALARLHKNVRQIVAYDLNRTKLASVGSPTAVAAAVATPSTGKGRPLGYVSVSVTGANDYAREVARLTQLQARIATGGRLLASTLDESGPIRTTSGDATIAGRKYRGRFTTLAQAAGPPVQVGIFEEGSSIAGAIRDRRLLIGAILVAFLLLALLS